MIDILQHELVPKHEILSKKEKEDLLSRFNVREDQLPKILDSDTIIKKIDGKPGDIVKITRKSPIAGETMYYRVIVKS